MKIDVDFYLNKLISRENSGILTSFQEYDQLYLKTNENLFNYMVPNLKDKNILTVTSSADHALYSVLNGATKITSFDINRLTKIYSNLKIAMIKTFSYEEFKEKLLNLYKNIMYDSDMYYFNDDKYIEKEILRKLYYLLSDDELDFWLKYEKYYKNSYDSIFRISDYDFSNSIFCSEENYNKIKENLKNTEIKYIDSDITSLDEKLDIKEQFDIVFLSNIFDYISYRQMNNTLKQISNYLHKDSKIFLTKFGTQILPNFKTRRSFDIKESYDVGYYYELTKKRK